MTTATRPDNLKTLEHLLQEGLQSKLSPLVPVKVGCWLKDKALVILAQHSAAVVPDSQQVFGSLEQTVREQYRSDSQSVKMYLRVEGQKQPYAFYSFKLEPRFESKATTATVDQKPHAAEKSESVNGSAGREEKQGTSLRRGAGVAGAAGEDVFTNISEEDSSPAPETSPASSDSPASPASPASLASPASPHPWDQPIQEEESLQNEPSDETPASATAKSKQTLLPLVVAGVGLSFFVFLVSLYLLSRPCVVGRCNAIPEARELSQRSLKRLQNPQSGKEVLEAQEQLMAAIGMLESIPFWSSHHGKAQELLKAYRVQAERVEEMVAALKTAVRAAYKSESPPYPASQWIEIQGMWREAIAGLEALPTSSNLQPLAQQKIKEYKTNLAQANQRLVKEREAQARLQEAKDAALIAEARQGVAQSLEHWRLVYGTWQTAMKRLKQIPQGTTAYPEAQRLSALYLTKMASVRDRKAQEQFAANAYNQGLRLAQRAQNAQVDNQWSVALTHWRNALNYVNQVPRDTFYYGKAQRVARSYSNAVKQAKGNLYFAVKVQQARSDLKQTCSGKTEVCNFTIANNMIKVNLTPAYTKLVKQAAIAAQTTGDSNSQVGLVKHIMTVGEALEAISDNARLRLELYDSEGNLIQTHDPNT